MNKYILCLGSNISPGINIQKAVGILSKKYKILYKTEVIETDPVGDSEQPRFHNLVLGLESEFDSERLKKELIEIENDMGRDRNAPRFAPRVIDIDIVALNGEIVDNDYYTRDFLKKLVDKALYSLSKEAL